MGRLVAKVLNFFYGFVAEPRALAALLRAERIGLVHLNNSILRNHGWMVGARTGRSSLPDARARDQPGVLQARSRLLARGLRAVICISGAVTQNFVRCGLGHLPLVTIPNGLDPADMVVTRPRDVILAELGVPVDRLVVGIVGNIRRWKGQEVVIRALARLRDVAPDMVLVLIGAAAKEDAVYKQQLEALVRDVGLVRAGRGDGIPVRRCRLRQRPGRDDPRLDGPGTFRARAPRGDGVA